MCKLMLERNSRSWLKPGGHIHYPTIISEHIMISSTQSKGTRRRNDITLSVANIHPYHGRSVDVPAVDNDDNNSNNNNNGPVTEANLFGRTMEEVLSFVLSFPPSPPPLQVPTGSDQIRPDHRIMQYARELLMDILTSAAVAPGQQGATAAAPSTEAAATLFQDKIKHRVFSLDNNSIGNNNRKKPRNSSSGGGGSGNATAGKKPFVTAKESRRRRLFQPTGPVRYTHWEPMHRLWLQYMMDVSGVGSGSQDKDKDAKLVRILKADFHGAILEGMLACTNVNRTMGGRLWCSMLVLIPLPLPLPLPISTPTHLIVIQCKNPPFVGTRGIVVQELENCVKVVTEKNQLKSKNSSSSK